MSEQAMIYNLPEQILVQILVNLPVKSLGKCMCVCKAWNSLIKDPIFISSHLNDQKSPQKDNFFVVDDGETLGKPNGVYFDNQEFSKYPQLQFNQHVVGSCNGLLLLVDSVYYCTGNPIIREWVRLPIPASCIMISRAISTYGFGFDSRTNDYKVLKITRDPMSYTYRSVQLYSLKKNFWKTLAPTKYGVLSYSMVFVSGIFHSFGLERTELTTKLLLLGFDMNEEAFKEIMLPENLRNKSLNSALYVLPYAELSSIAVTARDGTNNHDVWIMEKYGEVETWTKIFRIEGPPYVPWFSRILGFRRNGGSILGYLNSNLMDPCVIEGNHVEVRGRCPFVCSYVESLVLLDQVSENGSRNASSASNSIEPLWRGQMGASNEGGGGRLRSWVASWEQRYILEAAAVVVAVAMFTVALVFFILN